MVQFSMKDGVPQFSFMQYNMGNNSGNQQQQQLQPQQQQQASNNAKQVNGNSLTLQTLQLPMPTPISNFQQDSSTQQQQQLQERIQVQQPQQQQQNKSMQAPPAQPPKNGNQQMQQQQRQQFALQQQAQVLATPQGQQQQVLGQQQQVHGQQQVQAQQQQVQGQLQAQGQQQQTHGQLQAQGQQQQTHGQQQQAQGQQQQSQTPNYAALFAQQANLFQQQNMMQQQNPQMQQQQNNMMQQQQNSQGQQQNPQQQFNFNDPGAFLQQLQVAQLQQLAVQAQQQQAQRPTEQPPVMSNSAGTGGQAQLQQQMQAQFAQHQAQAQATASASAAPVPVQTSSSSLPRSTGAPPVKRAKTIKKPKAVPKTKVAKSDSITGIVSASDTDVETNRKVKATKKAAAAAKKASAMGMDMDDDDDDMDMPEMDMTDMTDSEKAKANRDRNREHARNTRLRKKEYLERLKTTVDDLCRERDTLVSERAGAANLLVEMHNTRTEVLMSFFALRSSNEKRRKLWSSILDESCFNCVMPVTPYRSFPASEVQVSKCQRTVFGIDGMMADTASIHVLFDSLVDRFKHPYGKVDFRYTLVTEDAVVAGNQVMARWAMTTLNAVDCGARMEVAKQGMLCCKFNSAHKIVGVELMFDVMAFMLQLKQAAGSDSFSVIPNTVQTCQRSFDKPMVMTLADAPYTIVQVNKLWEDMTGYTAAEVVGKSSCGILQGPEKDNKPLSEMMQEIRFKRPASATLINFKKTGERFRHFLLTFPLSTDSRITHYVALTCQTDSCVEEPAAQAPIAPEQLPIKAKQAAQVPQFAVPQPVPTNRDAGAMGPMPPPAAISQQNFAFESSKRPLEGEQSSCLQ